MTLADLLATLERRAVEADATGASAPLAAVYRQILAELATVDVTRAENGRENGPTQLLNAAVVAERLGCSVRYVYAKAPTFPFTVHIGGLIRFSEPGLEQWIRGRAA